MRVLIDIGHPGHVHLYKNLYFKLIEKGYQVYVIVKNVPVALELLNSYKIPYRVFGNKGDTIRGKFFKQIFFDFHLFIFVITKKIDVAIGSSITIAHVGWVTKMTTVVLDDDDDEVQPLFVKFAHPYCTYLLSPDVLAGRRKRKDTIYYPGYHELAYLHPNQFSPDTTVLRDLELKKDDRFFVLRFNVFMAHHDRDMGGMTLDQKKQLVGLLKQHGKVFITTERQIERELEDYQLKIGFEKIHSLMAYADMFIGDSQTMTSEASVLGTPSLRCNSFVGRISYLREQEERYGLTYGFHLNDFQMFLQKIEALLKNNNLKKDWQEKRNRMLSDKLDVTAYITDFIQRLESPN